MIDFQITTLAFLLISLATSGAIAQEENSYSCSTDGVVLQILGSGGPFANGRASSGYLLWVDGKSRVMVDAGGGTFAHFGEVGADIADLQLLALSHFHPDHSAEVPALLWPLTGALKIAGPSGSEAFPSIDEYIDGLFGPTGVFRVVSQRFQFQTLLVDVNAPAAEILREDALVVTAMGVPHGDVPALAFRVEIGDATIAFSSDQNGSNPAFVDFVRDVDLLIVHFIGNEDGTGRADLHAKPSVWGKIAQDAGVDRLVLSHLPENQNFETNLGFLQEVYTGPLTVAEDFMCLAID
ncbi:MAG: MBL fold metallo-hydrolase [SAR86 cluster bacterium]|uniref:MBL fold metallo-hydrolase n=1 Tax=SAR86 cluster bacterium TaxID=2030880 RepID=A0A2A5AXQ0_9GAMM|nr:MAG: MBL fold metallo-hydrolase [SAR86 cluster bacterium]